MRWEVLIKGDPLARVQKLKVSMENIGLSITPLSQYLKLKPFRLVNFEQFFLSYTRPKKDKENNQITGIFCRSSKLNKRVAGQVKGMEDISQKWKKMGESRKNENRIREIKKMWENLWQEGSSWFREKGKQQHWGEIEKRKVKTMFQTYL